MYNVWWWEIRNFYYTLSVGSVDYDKACNDISMSEPDIDMAYIISGWTQIIFR